MADEKNPNPVAPGTGEVVQKGGGTLSVTVDGTTPPPAPEQKPADRPTWLPEKFKSAEDLATAYAELEKKQGGQKPADAKAPEATTPVPQVTKPSEKLSADELAKVNKEYASAGKLSDETYRSLAGKGLSKEVVDQHIEGQKAVVEAYTNKLAESVGGRDELTKLIGWAGETMTDEEIATINGVLTSGNEFMAKTALAGLKAKYVEANGSEPSLVGGTNGGRTPGIEPFKSNHEVTTAMGDRRYKVDPAYRAKVEARLAVTNTFNP